MSNLTIKQTIRAAALLLAVTWAGPSEEAIAQSHLGQPIKEHVVLRDGYSDLCGDFRVFGFYRVQADGRRSRKPFVVPAGKLFVLTDTIWDATVATRGATFNQGWAVRLVLWSVLPDGTGSPEIFVSQSRLVPTEGLTNISGGDSLVSGVRVGTSRSVCAKARHIQYTGNGSSLLGSARVAKATLYGYLIDKR